MTEDAWLRTDEPAALLLHLAGGTCVNDRKLTLWVEACRAAADANSPILPTRWTSLADDANLSDCLHTWSATDRWDKTVSKAYRAALLREIVGNPFAVTRYRWEKQSLPPSVLVCSLASNGAVIEVCEWVHDRNVQGLARTIATERAFAEMPVLADALEDAGCTDAAILEHCRGREPCQACRTTMQIYAEERPRPGLDRLKCHADCSGWIPLRCPHVPGCHVLSLLPGEE